MQATNLGCAGSGGYSDIHNGTGVAVQDASGTTVALGQLQGSANSSTGCTFEIAVYDVPAGKQFYKVSISNRGVIDFTEDALRRGISLNLG